MSSIARFVLRFLGFLICIPIVYASIMVVIVLLISAATKLGFDPFIGVLVGAVLIGALYGTITRGES